MAYALIFASGLAGSLHCVGMCGGFPLALAAGSGSNLSRQLLYNLGRLNTLVVIGGVSGAAGAAVIASGPVWILERALAIVAGTFMMVVGLEMAGVIANLTTRGAALAQATVGRLLGGVIRSRSAAAPLALGVFNAFLPCQLIYAFAARAASTPSIGSGMLTMAADVGIAVASATDLARLTADVVVVGTDLRKVPWLLGHARRVRRVIRHSLAWAFAYNAVAVVFAAAGILTPIVASVAMLASSVAVVANARRLAQDGGPVA